MSRGKLSVGACVFTLIAAGSAPAQSPRVLYTWDGTGNVQDWAKAFGDLQEVTIENTVAGELAITETGATAGAAVAIRDGHNRIAEGGPSEGGLDLTGLSALEFDLGHDGAGTVGVQFYVQATPGYAFVPLGPDQAVEPGVNTYVAPLADLLPEQIAYIRLIGINIRDHVEEGNLAWTLREVRSAGTPLAQRDFATHEPGAPDGALQGAYVNFGNVAVQGNDGGQNQTGLSVNDAEPPAGNTGSLHWVDLAVSGGGGAITWGNGTAFLGNSFNERPADMSNYTRIAVRMAATNVTEGVVSSVQVGYFLQTGGFNFFGAGTGQDLPADGEFHELSFPITAVPDLDFVDSHGLRINEHLGGDLMIDVDYVRAIGSEPFPDCNQNDVPDERDLVEGTSQDCNRNAEPDECDISGSLSLDCNANGIPDECDVAGDGYVRVIYAWNGTGDTRAWFKNFGANDLEIVNEIEGELTVREIGTEGAGAAVSDSFNNVSEFTTTLGGLDLVGMEALEIDMGHGGTGDIMVQFFVQATPASTYVALGPDQAIAPGVKTYTAPLANLSFEQLTYLRTIGINMRDHLAEGNVEWTIREVRATGLRLARRDYAVHEPGSSDNGLQGAVVTAENAAVEGNDGGRNQTGLRHNASASPPGNTGALQWTDVVGLGGGVVSWFNGTVFTSGAFSDSFNERPTDMSSYSKLLVRMAATNTLPGDVAEVGVLYFLQTGNFQYHQAGEILALPADGEFYELAFPLGGIPDREFTDAHGIDIQDHPDGTVIIDVDRIRAVREETGDKDCNGNGIPDDCDIAGGVLTDANANGVPDLCEMTLFRRGDADANGALNITDAVRILNVLFLGTGALSCPDAADSDDDGAITITDAIRILNVLFLGTGSIPPPGSQTCGADPTADQLAACGYEPSSC